MDQNRHQLHRVKMSDGIHLATYLTRPSGPPPYPVVFTRSSNGLRELVSDYWASQGYACVFQISRGKFESEGEFNAISCETKDGVESLDWIANQSWCDGNIGMFGCSYRGLTQIPVAQSGHECLKMIAPYAAGSNYFRNFMYLEGAFALQFAVRWGLKSASGKTEGKLNGIGWRDLYQMETLEEIFEKSGLESPSLRTWVKNDCYNDYWKSIDQTLMYDRVKCPALHLGCWFDQYSTAGDIEAFQQISKYGGSSLARDNQKLLIGPWAHCAHKKRQCGEWDFGEHSVLDVDAHIKRHFDYWLRGIDDGVSKEAKVTIFMMGENKWENYSEWPPKEGEMVDYYLSAFSDLDEGVLSSNVPSCHSERKYCYDPKVQIPYLGFPQSHHELLKREDLLVYQSTELNHELICAGQVELDLWIKTNVEDTQFIATLCVMSKELGVVGLVHGVGICKFREGFEHPKKMIPNRETKLKIDLHHIAYTFPKGSKIVLLIGSSAYPVIYPHSNTIASPFQKTEAKIATQIVMHGSEYASVLKLPVLTQ